MWVICILEKATSIYLPTSYTINLQTCGLLFYIFVTSGKLFCTEAIFTEFHVSTKVPQDVKNVTEQ